MVARRALSVQSMKDVGKQRDDIFTLGATPKTRYVV